MIMTMAFENLQYYLIFIKFDQMGQKISYLQLFPLFFITDLLTFFWYKFYIFVKRLKYITDKI